MSSPRKDVPIYTNLQDKIVLVTGGASGIGHASALAFAREGATVIISDIDTDGGPETAATITDLGGKATFIRTDVSHPESVTALFQQIMDTYGQLDCAFNNAGIGGGMSGMTDYPDDIWARVIAVNLTGVWLCMKQEIRHMLKTGGAIVNMASVAGLLGTQGLSAYAASKHGVIGLTKSAALEYARAKIRVNAVCPGFIDTPMVADLMQANPRMEENLRTWGPMRRMGEPEEVAAMVVWLCSDAASYVNGQAIAIDGGFVVQ